MQNKIKKNSVFLWGLSQWSVKASIHLLVKHSSKDLTSYPLRIIKLIITAPIINTPSMIIVCALTLSSIRVSQIVASIQQYVADIWHFYEFKSSIFCGIWSD